MHLNIKNYVFPDFFKTEKFVFLATVGKKYQSKYENKI